MVNPNAEWNYQCNNAIASELLEMESLWIVTYEQEGVGQQFFPGEDESEPQEFPANRLESRQKGVASP